MIWVVPECIIGTMNGEVRDEEISACALQCRVVHREAYCHITYVFFCHIVVDVVVSVVPYFLQEML
jgi:hypothetical protein